MFLLVSCSNIFPASLLRLVHGQLKAENNNETITKKRVGLGGVHLTAESFEILRTFSNEKFSKTRSVGI